MLRAELRRGDGPGQLVVRVFVAATEDLAAWAEEHREPMAELRSELSLRLPSARLLEFTSDAPDAPVISMPDDGSLAGEQLSSQEIVVRALALLRQNQQKINHRDHGHKHDQERQSTAACTYLHDR